MKKQAYNPYLPSYEYIPDGEPYVFGDRLYIYGSHDQFGGKDFCLGDYVCWSAPIDDLGSWRFEGTIYGRLCDPLNQKGNQYLYAPDVQQGPDGRYYLYYVLNLSTVISVAVCDTPAGKYEFYGHVKYPDGTMLGSRAGEVNHFDPGVLVDEDGRVFLYTGFAPNSRLMHFVMSMRKRQLDGGYFVELEQDMITVKKEPVRVIPGPEAARGTDFEGHAFMEASSIRKIKGIYYLVYSSQLSHELCYAVSDRPDGGFRYQGTIISNGDIGLPGVEQPRNYTGNNHGSIVEIAGAWYVFYHRQTNKRKCCRQGCAESIAFLPDGRIPQVEMTSCGLNGKPLLGTGVYEARIACNLGSAAGTFAYVGVREPDQKGHHPYFTQSGADREKDGDQYIANLRDGSWAGFKYFLFDGEKRIAVKVRGTGEGVMEIAFTQGGKPAAQIPVKASKEWKEFASLVQFPKGKQAVYFTYRGKGAMDFYSFAID